MSDQPSAEQDDLPARIVAVLTEHEYRWTTHGLDRPYDVIHCAGDCDWSLRQKVLMSDDYVIEQHREHVVEQIVALVLPPEGQSGV